jgi:multidrug resistance efflux pump
MTRRNVIAAGVAGAVLAGYWVFAHDTLPGSVWADAERGDLVLTVEVSGVLAAVNSSPIGPPQLADSWDFKIAMLAPEGSDVPAGAPVLGFDTTELDRKLLEKRAESESAGKRIEKKEKDAEIARKNDEMRLAEAVSRQKKAALELDVPPELVKSQQLKESRLNLEDANREIEFLNARFAALRHADDVALSALRALKAAADRRVGEIQASIEAMTVKAPRGGTVVYATNWRDEKKKVGDSAWRGERVLEIPDLSEMKGEGEIDESDAGRIAVGQTVRFKLEAHPDIEFTGKIASILSTVQRQSFRSPVKVVKILIAFDATDSRKMRPGMRFRGTVETGRIAHTLLVPADAVFPTASGPVAFRRSPVGYTRRPLVLGSRNETSVEVKAGLDAGDRVARRDLDADARRTR